MHACWIEKRENGEKELYCQERKNFYNNLGLSTAEIENWKDKEKGVQCEVIRIGSDIDKQIMVSKIGESRFNKEYKDIVTESIPMYLSKDIKGIDIDIIAGIRCGNYENANKYWAEENDRKCKFCKINLGTWEHLCNGCTELVKFLKGMKLERKELFCTDNEKMKRICKIFKEAIKQVKTKENLEKRTEQSCLEWKDVRDT